MALVTTGSLWTNGAGVVFKVTAVARTGSETWIVYNRTSDPKSSFSCLEPDFLQRFKKHSVARY